MGANAAPQSWMEVQPFISVSSLFRRRWASRWRICLRPISNALIRDTWQWMSESPGMRYQSSPSISRLTW